MPRDVYRDAAEALMALGASLHEGRNTRFEKPDREPSTDPQPSNRPEVSNPTLDTVADGVRWEVSDAVSEAEKFLALMAVTLTRMTRRIDRALAVWHNEDP